MVQVLVWTNALSLAPAVFGDSPLAIRCMILACVLVSTGSSFKLIQLRKHADLLNLLLGELKSDGIATPMIVAVRKVCITPAESPKK